ncbi:MAG: hypothetical protein J7K65_02220, partial [Planctomycetes bacterium]|nr:hypothetical protein [Planctomycetota bacterium]
IVVHEIVGADSEKEKFLRDSVNTDFGNAERFQPPSRLCETNRNRNLTVSYFNSLQRQGKCNEVFAEAFEKYNATHRPMFNITAIVDGIPKIDLITNHEPLIGGKLQEHTKLGSIVMDDYLEKYMTPQGFDLPLLINNDYLNAIKLLFNNHHYVSCMKLFVSLIDTMAFVEFGDMRGNFVKWLDNFANLNKVGITPSQLWELRNSILHMSNLDSRKVINGSEKRMSFCVAESGYVPDGPEVQYFNLMDFINVISEALSVWSSSYNDNPIKRTVFIERYDRIISDDRLMITERSKDTEEN